MATSKGANTYNRQNWEQSDFPILCQTCLGDNPYVRMICVRPFTIFKWCPGAKMRYKKTEICQTCAKLKNVCQTCLLDLEYGLPIEVRDKALAIADTLPRSDVNKEFFHQTLEKELANTDGTVAAGVLGKSQAASDLLMKLARTTPYYKRNRPHICSFWVKGECKRGEECPYRHEMPNAPDDPLSNQNIKDRFYGVNDPVAAKMLKRAESMPKLESPSDKSITTLYVGGLDERIKEEDLRNFFYQYGEIRSVVVASSKSCAFICYTSRQAAEMAAERSFNKVIIKGKRLKVLWGRSQEQRSGGGKDEKRDKLKDYPPVPGLPGALPPAPTEDPPIMEPPNLFDPVPSEENTSSNIPIPATYPNAPPIFPAHIGPPPPQGVPPPPPNMRAGFPPGPPPFMQRFPPPPGTYTNQMQPPSVRFPVRNGPPPARHGLHYPSQDPHRMGTEGSSENSSA